MAASVGVLSLVLLAVITTVCAQRVTDCPDLWVRNAENCYRFVTYPLKNRADSQEECMKYGAALVSINSNSEFVFVQQQLLNAMGPFRYDTYTSGYLRKDINRFQWDGDGTDVPMPNFERERLEYWVDLATIVDDFAGSSIVYHFLTDSYKWMRSGSHLKMAYICEIDYRESYRIVQKERGYDYGMGYNVHPATLKRGSMMTAQPRDTVVLGEGRDRVYLECAASGNPTPVFEWYRGTVYDGMLDFSNATLLTSQIDIRYTLTEGRLTIYNPNPKTDRGQYQCKAVNEYGTILSDPATLSFGSLGQFPNVNLDTAEATEDLGFQLVCPHIPYHPAVRYQWAQTYVHNMIQTSVNQHIFISSNGKLYFSRITKVDEDIYYCSVSLTSPGKVHGSLIVNEIPSAISKSLSLKVLQQSGGNVQAEIQNEFPLTYPVLPLVGQLVEVECFAYGTGTLQYKWTRKDGRDLPASVNFRDHNRVMEIYDVTLDDSGIYNCEVYSEETRVRDDKNITISIQSRPLFTVPLENQFVDEGNRVSWRCYAEGIPEPTYRWYKNGEPLRNEIPGITVRRNVMTIENVKDTAHKGMYQCSATNIHGTAYTTAELRVLKIAPTFTKRVRDPLVLASVGGSAVLECGFEAAPFPEIIWNKQYGGLGGNSEKLRNGDLSITNIQHGDSGVYICEATNSEGTGQARTELSVLDQTVINQAPQQRTEIMVNDTVFLYCSASTQRNLDLIYNWAFNGVPIRIDKDPHFSRGSGSQEGGLYIKTIQYKHEGRYTCIGRTQVDQDNRTGIVVVKGPPGPPAGIYVLTASVNSTTLILKFTDGMDHGSPITYYYVEGATEYTDYMEWRTVKGRIYRSEAIDQGELQENSDRRSVTLEGLNPSTSYKFRVRAENNHGLGVPSMPCEPERTSHAPPTKAPRKVYGGGGKVRDLTVKWEPLLEEEHHGLNFGYHVYTRRKDDARMRLVDGDDGDWDKETLVGKKERYVTQIDTRFYYTEYEAKVQAFNDAGDGPNSTTVVIYSAEALPTVTAQRPFGEGYNSSALIIFWTPVENTRTSVGGQLIGYKINYWIKDLEMEARATQAIFTGQMNEGLLIGLEHNTYYEFNIVVYNTAGNGPKSETFEQSTFNLPPQHYPTEVSVHTPEDGDETTDQVRIAWRGVTTQVGEEPLQGYMIRYWPAGTHIRNATDVDVGIANEGFISGLKRDVKYFVRVLGYSRGGDGKMSMPALPFTLENSEIPFDPAISEVKASSIIVLPSLVAILFSSLLTYIFI